MIKLFVYPAIALVGAAIWAACYTWRAFLIGEQVSTPTFSPETRQIATEGLIERCAVGSINGSMIFLEGEADLARNTRKLERIPSLIASGACLIQKKYNCTLHEHNRQRYA